MVEQGNLPNSAKPLANPIAVLREEFDDWAVLFNPDTAEAVCLDPVGVAVWKRLDGQRTLEQIARDLEDDFSEVPATAAQDLRAFVADLARDGFIGYEVTGAA